MPVISRFYGIVVLMYYFDNAQHKLPHIHIQCGEEEATASIPKGDLLSGSMPPAKLRLLLAWIEIHEAELLANWRLATEGQRVLSIDPLR
jgi:hypothetical protein